jgi:pyoverdine/dityrosine biosynthesis protein Dit1
VVRSAKYTWTDLEFDKWCKDEAKKLRDVGIKASTNDVTYLTLKRFLIPNNISLTQLIRPKIKLKRSIKWAKKGLY